MSNKFRFGAPVEYRGNACYQPSDETNEWFCMVRRVVPGTCWRDFPQKSIRGRGKELQPIRCVFADISGANNKRDMIHMLKVSFVRTKIRNREFDEANRDLVPILDGRNKLISYFTDMEARPCIIVRKRRRTTKEPPDTIDNCSFGRGFVITTTSNLRIVRKVRVGLTHLIFGWLSFISLRFSCLFQTMESRGIVTISRQKKDKKN